VPSTQNVNPKDDGDIVAVCGVPTSLDPSSAVPLSATARSSNSCGRTSCRRGARLTDEVPVPDVALVDLLLGAAGGAEEVGDDGALELVAEMGGGRDLEDFSHARLGDSYPRASFTGR
jgi:hypothetical protein